MEKTNWLKSNWSILIAIATIIGSIAVFKYRVEANEKKTDQLEVKVDTASKDVTEVKASQLYLKEKTEDIKAQTAKIEGKIDQIAAYLIKKEEVK